MVNNVNGDIIIYQTDDGLTKIDVRVENETVWLSQQQMAELYETTKQNISLQIKNIFDEEDNNYLSEENPYLEGILISVSNVVKEKRTINLEITKYKSSLGSVTNQYEATYKNNKWDIKLKTVSVS